MAYVDPLKTSIERQILSTYNAIHARGPKATSYDFYDVLHQSHPP